MRSILIVALLVTACTGSPQPTATGPATLPPTSAVAPTFAPAATSPPVPAAIATMPPPVTAAPTLRPAPTAAVTTAPSPAVDRASIVAQACLGTQYERCVESLLLIMDMAPGSLVAICDYSDGTGDIVLIEDEAEAEGTCSADGMISPSRVVTVLRLP